MIYPLFLIGVSTNIIIFILKSGTEVEVQEGYCILIIIVYLLCIQ